MNITTKSGWPNHLLAASLVTVGIIVLGAIGATYTVSSAGAAANGDDHSIRVTVTSALHATLELPTEASVKQAAANGLDTAGYVSSARKTLASIYTGNLLDRKVNVVERNAVSDPIKQAGVRNIVFKSVVIAGDGATVAVECESWTIVSVPVPGGSPLTANPVNTIEWSFHLTKTDGLWLVDDEHMSFASGTGP